jgi:ADP-ribose pyrophosphatase
MEYYEKTIGKKHIYSGKILNLDSLEVLLPDGNTSTREIITHPGASVIIPISDNNEVYMVRQFRKPIEKETLELPAGKLDKGEEPIECAKRELMEETGLTAGKVKHLVSVYSTPGFSNEILHIYGAAGLTEGEAHADEDEFISSEKIPIKKLVDMVLNNEISDAKTVIGILLADKVAKGEIGLD